MKGRYGILLKLPTSRSGNLNIRFVGVEIRRSGKQLYIPRSDDRGIPRRRINLIPYVIERR
ncbi:MAG: hypothetical protein UV63_C0027G0012 [Microgenomates group bacterium GW2011_GWC1_43_11]|nr:MAG: hypothetical protein UV63_C0027G0012 [Microgenomates group bacterium GW2011_GWC1_43_11]